MTSSLLRRPRGSSGLIHDLTPAAAGWTHVGFRLWRLAPGEVMEDALPPDREGILVLVEGRARVEAAGQDWGLMGGRLSVFEQTPPHCLYLPPGSPLRISAETPVELALCTAPGRGTHPARRLGPEGIAPVPRGEGTNLRHIHNIAMEEREVAQSLLVTEVFTPPGHWSSYPPHRHDEDRFPEITLLEETYYHRLDTPGAFAFQRVYTEDGALDECMAVADRDLVLVPRGHHPCGAPHGVKLYYLNVMAGPLRRWRFAPDPAFRHLFPT